MERYKRWFADVPYTLSDPNGVAPAQEKQEEKTGKLSVTAEDTLGLSGWFFINGELKGPLPLQKDFVLAPGEYELRCIAATGKGYGELRTFLGKVRVERGNSTNCYFRTGLADGSSTVYPSGFVARRSNDVQEKIGDVIPGMMEEAERNQGVESEELPRRWQQFQDTPEWRGVQNLRAKAQALGLYTRDRRPEAAKTVKRRDLWMDLPDHLGGPREVNAGQLRAMREWYVLSAHRFLQDPRPMIVCSKLQRDQDPKRYDRIPARYDELERIRKEHREYVEKALDDLIAALEKAPDQP
jgi:hypothetical protein